MDDPQKTPETAEAKMKRFIAEGGVVEKYEDEGSLAHMTDGSTMKVPLLVIRMPAGNRHHFIGIDPKPLGIPLPKPAPKRHVLSVAPAQTKVEPKGLG